MKKHDSSVSYLLITTGGLMSRYKDKLYELEIDAIDMSKEEFIKKHGEFHLDIWEDVQRYLKRREE
jgi:hypothetical protein